MKKTMLFIIVIIMSLATIIMITKINRKKTSATKNQSLLNQKKPILKTLQTIPVTIFLQPFSDFPVAKTGYLINRLKTVYSNSILLPVCQLAILLSIFFYTQKGKSHFLYYAYTK